MKDKKPTSEYTASFESNEYRTGATQPPKKNSGWLALILITVIFFGGIASMLGILKFHLLVQQMERMGQANTSVSFSDQNDAQNDAVTDPQCSRMGLHGKSVPYFWQLYRQLPQGIYITEVLPDSHAQTLGISPGDILLSLDGQRVKDVATVNLLLSEKLPGSSVHLIIYRNGMQLPYVLDLE